MRIERYYSSIREDRSTLVTGAITLLDNQDYAGFFKACGPNYVRGIRRAQEVVAFFSLESSSQESASSFSKNLRTTSWRESETSTHWSEASEFYAITQKMKIGVLGYGLGLTEDGSESLLATTVQEFDEIMDFAWKSMTTSPNAAHIGMIYGMEVLPWVENLAFQIASGVLDEVIEIPIPRSLIPNAHRIDGNSAGLAFDNTNNRLEFTCKRVTDSIDKYGKCCESSVLYDLDSKQYDETNPEFRICRPARQLESAVISENVVANGEFVARLDRALRYKINQMSTLERCISAIRAIPDRENFRVLKSKDTTMNDYGDHAASFTQPKLTVIEMKYGMDPWKDYGPLKSVSKELDEFIDMFYQPCLAAIYGMNIGNSPGTDVKYFMAYPWHSHTECKYLSCFGNGMRWDRDNGGGCVPGLLKGGTTSSYSTTSTSTANCKKSLTSYGDTQVCLHDATKLENARKIVADCLEATQGVGNYLAFLDNYCLPELTDEYVDEESQKEIQKAITKHCTCKATVATDEVVNIALHRPTTQSSTWSRYKSSLAVDGNRDGTFHRNSCQHTLGGSSHWWKVDLVDLPTDVKLVNKIAVYLRRDHLSRMRGTTVKCIDGRTDSEIWMGTMDDDRQNQEFTKTDFGGNEIECSEIKVESTGSHMHIAEVEVYETVTVDATVECGTIY